MAELKQMHALFTDIKAVFLLQVSWCSSVTVMASSSSAYFYAHELMQAPLIRSFFSLLWVLGDLQPGIKGLNTVQILWGQLCADPLLLPDLPQWQHIFEAPGVYIFYIITPATEGLSGILCQVAMIWYQVIIHTLSTRFSFPPQDPWDYTKWTHNILQ